MWSVYVVDYWNIHFIFSIDEGKWRTTSDEGDEKKKEKKDIVFQPNHAGII